MIEKSEDYNTKKWFVKWSKEWLMNVQMDVSVAKSCDPEKKLIMVQL